MTRPDPGPWADLSLATSAVEGLGELLATWQARAEPDAPARRAGSAAITAIDTATAALYRVRARLITETRRADDQAAAREGPPGTGTAPDGPAGPAQGRHDAEPPPSATGTARVPRGGDRPGAAR